VLLGGQGLDVLTGGDRDDLLPGGRTLHDADFAALEAVFAEWASTASYATRIGHLLGTKPGGKNGAVRLNATTVFDEGLADVLTGGAHLDWFFQGLATVLADCGTGGVETVTAAG